MSTILAIWWGEMLGGGDGDGVPVMVVCACACVAHRRSLPGSELRLNHICEPMTATVPA
jgi:hypothetical protein